MPQPRIPRLALALLTLALAPALWGQDTRTVTDPVIPPACTTLDAHLTSIPDGVYNTLAPADESKLDTARIQQALDTCTKGQAVVLTSQGAFNAFVSGPLELRTGVTLVVAAHTTLFETLDPALLATAPGACGVISADKGRGCKPLISVDHVKDAAIMGDGVIDGRGGEPILGTRTSAWDLAQQATQVAGASTGSCQKVSRLIVADHADNFTLYRITLRNSPNFHVSYNAGDGFTVWGVKIDTVRRVATSPHPLSRNTDGIDPGNGARNVTITQSFFREGDDNIALKGGVGGISQVSITHNHMYWGHGMSIGSETNGGVSKIRVSDLTLDGTDSGIRIKSTGMRGGLVHDVRYDDICIRNSPRPLDITAAYAANGPVKGNSPPTFTDITLHNVTISGGGKILLDGYDETHRAQLTLDGVFLADPNARYTYTLDHADITIAPEGTNLHLPPGTDATIKATPTTATSSVVSSRPKPTSVGEVERSASQSTISGNETCKARFVPFPTQ